MKTETITLETPSGQTAAFLASPDRPNGKALIIIHEWWGLNDHIKDISKRYADEGFAAFAPDLYRGRLAKDPKEAADLMGALSPEDGLATIDACLKTASSDFEYSHLGISGFCMGGTFALLAACELEGLSAAVPFYGDIPDETVLKRLRVPTLFISASEDKWINTEKVAAFEDAAERLELPVRTLKYNADHAFFNNTRPEVFNEEAARDAWAMTVGFFLDNL